MFEAKTQLLLKQVLEKLSSKFSPIFNCLRVPFAINIGERKNKRRSIADYLAQAASDNIFLISSFFFNKKKFKNIKPINQKFVLVLDHNRKPFINLFLELIENIPKADICLITASRSIYKILPKDAEYKVIFIDNYTFYDLKVVRFIRKVFREIIKIDKKMPIFDKVSVFTNLLKIASYENLYTKLLSENIVSVLTLYDAHLHEQVITRVANKKNIITHTLQHGMVNDLWFPIVSDYFFVWNEHTKKICNTKYSVRDSQMIVSGNPFINNQEINRIKNDVFTVTYIVTNWGEIENIKLFETFLKISNIKNIKMLVKLRPNPPSKMFSSYNSRIKKLENKNIEIIENDIKEVLSKTDLIVTFNSGVPVDAMPYHIPSILLDIFEYINLDDFAGHYEDCLIVTNEKDYIELVNRIVTNRDYYNKMVKKVISVQEKYYFDVTRDETIKLISENIVNKQI